VVGKTTTWPENMAETSFNPVDKHGRDTFSQIFLYFAAGFLSYLVLKFLSRAFHRFVIGVGHLRGKRGTVPGFLIKTSRGNTHCILYRRYANEQTCRNFAAVSQTDSSEEARDEQNMRTSQSNYLLSVSSFNTHGESEGQAFIDSQIQYVNLIVLVHGFAGSTSIFRSSEESDYVRILRESGRDVLVFDLYGHGYSDGPDTQYSAELFAEQLRDLCMSLNIQAPFDLLGFSLGASVAVCFAHKYPGLVQKLVLQSPSIAEASMRLDLKLALHIPFVREIAIALIIPRLGNGACQNNPAALRASYRLLLTRLKGGGRWTLAGEQHSTLNMLEDICTKGQVPVLCLWGVQDTVVPFSECATVMEAVPKLRLITHPTSKHECFAKGKLEIRDHFLSAILAFLDEPPGFEYLLQT